MSFCISAYSGTSGSLFQTSNVIFNGELDKESIMYARIGMKNQSLAIAACHHSAMLMMPEHIFQS